MGGTAGGSAAYNEVTNNYLRHVESERLTALSKKKELGQCDADCEREMSDLRALDIARDRALANCVGVSSAACEQTRQLVRTAAAEYIRNEEILNTRGSYYGWQSAHTTSLAYETIDGKAAGVWQSVRDMFVGVYDVLALGYNAKNGDLQAINQLVASSRAVSEFLSDASNLPYLVGFMSPAQRETFATAVESNDGKTVGKMLTDQTVAFIGTLSIAADAAKLATLSGTALRDAVISATSQKSVGAKNTAVMGSVADANFAQSTIRASEIFSQDGIAKYSQLAGKPINTVDDLAAALQSGAIKPSQIPVDFVVVADGTKLILNTRTSVALDRAGIPKSDWYGTDKTGLPVPDMQGKTFNDLAADQLKNNKLPSTGTPVIPKGKK